MDKASVLGDAIKYVKELQERVNLLEEESKKRTVESFVFVKKSQFSADDDTSSCNENFEGHSAEALPEIEARISNKDVLIRIHCEKNRGVVVKVLGEIEKLHLSVVNSSVLPYGNSTLVITVITQVISVIISIFSFIWPKYTFIFFMMLQLFHFFRDFFLKSNKKNPPICKPKLKRLGENPSTLV